MRILVSGASGFIGSSLVPELRSRGHDVYEMMRYVASRFDFYEADKRVFADLRDPGAVRAAILKVKPDVIFHLAAMSAVAYSFGHEHEVGEVIYGGTIAVADAAREAGAFLIHASTSEVYGRGDHTFPLTEDQRLGATSPYAVAKIAAEEYLRQQRFTYHNPVIIVRPFNTIGRGLVRNSHFVVERAINQALSGGVIQLHDSRPLRDFMFRTDHVGMYLAVLDHLKEAEGETFNACTGDCWSIERMAQHVAKVVSARSERPVRVEFSAVPDRPLDIERLHGSNAKAQAILGWKPKYTIAEGIAKAVDEWAAVLGK